MGVRLTLYVLTAMPRLHKNSCNNKKKLLYQDENEESIMKIAYNA